MATLYERNESVNQYYELYGNWAGAQSFTPSVSHQLTEIGLYISRSGDPGTITVEIYLSDTGGNDDKPVGGILATTTFAGSAAPVWTTKAWVEGIEFLSPASLVAGTKYVLVVKASAGDASNKLWWAYSTNDPYADGKRSYSPDGGANWYPQSLHDHTFREYGVVEVAPTITDQSTDTVVRKGEQVSLFITATGTPAPTYQWYKNDVSMSGETNSTLVFYTVSTATYKCKATNDAGEDESNPIVVTVVSNPYTYNLFGLPLDADRIM